MTVSPAHAGIDLPKTYRLKYYLRFPRPRGDRPRLRILHLAFGEFPPPTRG